ncbi:MAG: sulfotransferase [Flavobacteriales bacterium]|nr:sulfotransferase [Flavobacteriales bacterium]
MREQIDTLFITGTGRSGTNILKKIMSRHSAIASLPFEYRFIIDPDGVIDFYRSYPALWSPYRADKQIKRLENFLRSLSVVDASKAANTETAKTKDPTGLAYTPPPYAGWELSKWIPGYANLIDAFINDIRLFSYSGVWPGSKENVEQNEMYFAPPMNASSLQPVVAQFIQACTDAIRKEQGKHIFQEDNTHNLLVAHDLLSLVPSGKMLHIVRDPRDVISSLQTQRWAPTHLDHLLPWYAGVMDTWREQRSSIDPDRYLEIRFEDLVQDPQGVLTKVCAFVGITLEADMLEIDLSAHHIGRYKDSFNGEEISRLNTALRSYMAEYDYPTS